MKQVIREQKRKERNKLSEKEIKEKSDIIKEKLFNSQEYKNAKTVFIADSDSLAMKDIAKIIIYIKECFPDVERITSYARAKTL